MKLSSWNWSSRNNESHTFRSQWVRIGFVSLVALACLVAFGWQSTGTMTADNNHFDASRMNRLARSDENGDGVLPVLTTNGVPARVAGSCVKVTPNRSSDEEVHVVFHWKGQTHKMNMTMPPDEPQTEQETRMLSSIHKAVHPEEYVEAARLKWSDARSGRVKSMVIHARRDARIFGLSDNYGTNASNFSMTPSFLRTFVQDTQLSMSFATVRVPVADVLAGCEFLKEGIRQFSLNVERVVGGQVYSNYVSVEMMVMTGCGSGGSIYGEFQELDGTSPTLESVTCESPMASFCEVQDIGTTSSLIGAVDQYEKDHGDGPMKQEEMMKVLADAAPEHVSGLHLQVHPDCFGGGFDVARCALAVFIFIGIVFPYMIIVLFSAARSGRPLDFRFAHWLFSGFSCFPRGIGILLLSGQTMEVQKLNPGSAVWSLASQNNSIYMTGHRDHTAVSEFVWITTASGRQVGASRGHFGIVFDDLSRNENCHKWKSDETTVWTWEMFNACHVHKRFEDFLGESNKKWSVFVHGGASGNSHVVSLEDVIGAELRMGMGLYNPYSMDGTLIANGILVSSHSGWILDSLVPARYDHVLPRVYQHVFSPFRAMYWMCPNCMIEGDRLLERGAAEYSALEIARAIWRSFVTGPIESLL